MRNNYSQASNSGQDRNSGSEFSQSQPFPWSQEQGDDWNFRDFLDILRRRSLILLGVASLVMTTSVISLTKQKPIYESNFRLLVEPVNDDTKTIDIVKDQNQTKSSLDYESQIQVLKSPELIGDVVKRLKDIYPEIDYSKLVASLTINRLGETKIIEVRYRNQNWQKAKTVTKQIADDYLQYSLQKRQTKLRQGIAFVNEQLPSIQQRVDRIQQDLQIFQQRNDFVDPETQTGQINNQVSILSQQRLAIDQQLAQARGNLGSLRQQNGELVALNDANLYQQLTVQLQELDAQIAQESARFQGENPTILALKDKRNNLLPLLRQEAERSMAIKVAAATNQVEALEIQNRELAKAEEKLEQKRKQLPILTRKYTEMQRGLQVATESLNRFLATREALQIQISQTELPWQLIQPPSQPQNPVSSDTKRSLLMSFLGSLALGIGVALLIEKLDNTYHTPLELKEKVKLPLLGIIPYEKQLHTGQDRLTKQQAAVVRSSDSLGEKVPDLGFIAFDGYDGYSVKFIEALRVLYTNIQFLSSDRPVHSVVVSSAMSGDGKSTIAFHLAQVAATMGQRVLLVDADLRQPQIHQLANLNNLWGLSNLISTNLPLNEVIQKILWMKQLSVITCGPIPPDPAKLLSSQKMRLLMEEFHKNFDLVIYDAPELVGLADANLLLPHTNGLLLVARMGKTDSSLLKRSLDNLKLSRMNILGVVGNG
ncbi:GumC family protein [Calothrix sp. PCC 6303]|uniref:GumC family protein n=1 Tax=Calothrix sp. PCC 6303 TaxID=1170562 RepID=UPI0002E151F1|nr:polysaccharide biosynthesis tyrosine autokinase [Calothrix sp. PCC 6303]